MYLILWLGFKGYLSTQSGCMSDLLPAVWIQGLKRRVADEVLVTFTRKPHIGQCGRDGIFFMNCSLVTAKTIVTVYWALFYAKYLHSWSHCILTTVRRDCITSQFTMERVRFTGVRWLFPNQRTKKCQTSRHIPSPINNTINKTPESGDFKPFNHLNHPFCFVIYTGTEKKWWPICFHKQNLDKYTVNSKIMIVFQIALHLPIAIEKVLKFRQQGQKLLIFSGLHLVLLFAKRM